MIKTRFAPSPTGLLHLGNARTALFSALFAQKNQGIFLLRVEDTDQERSKPEYEAELQNDLLWLGLDWDEGPQRDLGHGPYHQAQRHTIYESYFSQLQGEGMVYPCFCSETELALARKSQLSASLPPRYPGTCAHLSETEVKQRYEQGKKPTWRFRVHNDQTAFFTDLVRGEQRFATNDIGDFIIRRTDGSFPFLFTNAIDDSLMGVSHVMRGEDHVANTPRQLLILKALSLSHPEYAHLPLIVGDDNTPLSKRHGSWSVADLRSNGYLPGAIINYLARLGHYFADNSFFSLDQLAAQFDLDALGRAPARFDISQLQYWQKMALQQLDANEIWSWMGMVVQVLVPVMKRELFISTILPNIIFPADAVDWAQHLFSPTPLSLGSEQKEIIRQTEKKFFEEGLKVVQQCDWTYEDFMNQLKTIAQGKKLFQPLRVALTGQLHGPELLPIINLMGSEQVEMRFKQALAIE
ncbi:MAG: glutamate--tRNA ligase [Gammaproteobacteria bacterium]